jgi:PIN domain nuclease of toxin-antitoxin system
VALLLDTVALVRGFAEPEKLPVALIAQLHAAGARGAIHVSVASYWEIAVKTALGKLASPDDLPRRVAQHPDFTLLPIAPAHAWRVRTLPQFADHKDPFDRVLVAQALEERLTIVTPDPHFARYGVPVVW